MGRKEGNGGFAESLYGRLFLVSYPWGFSVVVFSRVTALFLSLCFQVLILELVVILFPEFGIQVL